MSDMFDVIPIDNVCNKKSDNKNESDKKLDDLNLNEDYDDIIDHSLSDNNIKKNKIRFFKLLFIILFYLNYVNYKKHNNKILIKSKL
jgi:hypothetical protein